MPRAAKVALIPIGALVGLGLLLLLSLPGEIRAFDTYRSDKKLDDNCYACHGDFRDSPYIERGVCSVSKDVCTADADCPTTETCVGGGTSWGDDLHDWHRSSSAGIMANNTSTSCDDCHYGNKFPVYLDLADGGENSLGTISCTGCHGRAEDGTGLEGYGLRERHRNTGAATCNSAVGCHGSDPDPAVTPPVGEDVMPPYYYFADPSGNWPNVPTGPCDASENAVSLSSPEGLDNDGDLIYDGSDTDCQAFTPGETAGPGLAPIIVTAHPTGSTLSLTYGTACEVDTNILIWGPIDPGNPYNYLDEVCIADNSGSYTWTFPTDVDSFYFLMGGCTATNEGSYGRNSSGGERPPHSFTAPCFLARDLTNPCP